MKRKCDVCGIEADDYWMKSFNHGSRTLWLCWECYQAGEREATQSDMMRGYKLHKISESKKRTK